MDCIVDFLDIGIILFIGSRSILRVVQRVGNRSVGFLYGQALGIYCIRRFCQRVQFEVVFRNDIQITACVCPAAAFDGSINVRENQTKCREYGKLLRAVLVGTLVGYHLDVGRSLCLEIHVGA